MKTEITIRYDDVVEIIARKDNISDYCEGTKEDTVLGLSDNKAVMLAADLFEGDDMTTAADVLDKAIEVGNVNLIVTSDW